jgi:hypothetical protein
MLPEPRLRVGGIGTPAFEVLAVVPTYSLGIPNVWISQRQVNYYSGIAVDIHGNPIGDRYPNNAFKGVAVDRSDPPTFESQATYLKRLGLLLAGEGRRLKKSDWEAEAAQTHKPLLGYARGAVCCNLGKYGPLNEFSGTSRQDISPHVKQK